MLDSHTVPARACRYWQAAGDIWSGDVGHALDFHLLRNYPERFNATAVFRAIPVGQWAAISQTRNDTRT
jgi:hypothetical protein